MYFRFLSSICCLIYLSGFSARGQAFTYPPIPKNAHTLEAMIPPGWEVLDSAEGDLNGDKVADAALVIQLRDSITVVKEQTDTVITQPRMLLLIFRNRDKGRLVLAGQSPSFILVHDNPAMDDPFSDITIEKGVLRISFHIFYNMGSWWITNALYKFRYERGQFALIGADHFSIHRATHDYEEFSFNFLTRKRSITRGNDEDGRKQTTWKTFRLPVLKHLNTLKQPFTWEIEGVYL